MSEHLRTEYLEMLKNAIAARDAEWRAAVERAKSRMALCSACRNGSDALDALLREVPHDGQ